MFWKGARLSSPAARGAGKGIHGAELMDSLPLRFAPAGNDKGAMPGHGGTFPAALS